MPQTILAFLAILALTTLTLDQRDGKIRAYSARVGTEIELLAHGVGIGTIEMIAARPFDEATKGGNTVESTDELTAPSFPDDSPSGVFDDVDDYHGVELTRAFETPDDTTTFTVTVAIHYLDDSSRRVSHRTYNKEIQVTVEADDSSNAEFSKFSTPVTLKRPVSYAPN
jgi:hypothetical protein